jgi:hypothetical protein
MKCQEKWHPATHAVSARLAEGLPRLLTRDNKELQIEETPPEAVQVDIQVFDPMSLNIPNIWLYIVFTENPNDNMEDDDLMEVAREVTRRVKDLLRDFRSQGQPTLAIDVFWGPGHGCIIDESGFESLTW